MPATARASFGIYSDEADVAALVRGIERGRGFSDERVKIRIEEVESVTPPPRARVEDAETARASKSVHGRPSSARRIISKASLRRSPSRSRGDEPGGDALRSGDRGVEGHLRSRNPGQHLRSRADLRCRGHADGDVVVSMTLTTPHCPVAESMPGEVEMRVMAVPGRARCRSQSGVGPAMGLLPR